MSINFAAVTFDCADAHVVATFWAAVLKVDIAGEAGKKFATISSEPPLFFQQVPEAKVAKNRVHIDLSAHDFESEAVRLEELGATRVREVESQTGSWITFTDVEGNEFDLIQD